MSHEKRILKAGYRICYPKALANELKGTISNGYSTANRSFLSWSGFNLRKYRRNEVLSPEELNRLVHLFVCGVTFIPRKVNIGNWSLQVCPKRTHLVWGRGGGGGLSKTLPVS